jgi:tRNA(Ile)-lysidine synthase
MDAIMFVSIFNANIVLVKLKSFIEKNQLFNKSDRIGLAISGGKDSVSAAHLLNDLKISFTMIHINYKLRGKESDFDEKFVKHLSKNTENCKGIKCISVDARKYAKKHHVSIQEAARNIRYDYFEKLKLSNQLDIIITAHHQDDQVETFFINLNRISGIKGLKSIPVKRSYIVRPLLAFNSDEIKMYVAQKKIEYREDKSNQSTNYLRNVIRHQILPVIQNRLPDFVNHTSKSIALLNSEYELLDFFIKQFITSEITVSKQGIFIPKSKITIFPQPEVLLYRILDKYGFNFSQCQQISVGLNGKTGKQYFSKTHQLLIDRTQIIISLIEDLSTTVLDIYTDGRYAFDKYTLTLKKVKKWTFSSHKNKEYLEIPPLFFPLTLRYWKKGDRFSPLGTKGNPLLSDFFINHKINNIDKKTIPLLCSNDTILWVVGYQISDIVRVRDGFFVFSVSF